MLSCAAPVGAKFREGERWNDIQGPLGHTGHPQGWTEGKTCQDTAVLLLDPCPTFKTHKCACEQTHTHTHRQTPFATLRPVPDSFTVEFWPWLCAASSQHMEGGFLLKRWILSGTEPRHTHLHTLAQAVKHKAQFILHIHTHKQSPSNNTPVGQILGALSLECQVLMCVCMCVHLIPNAH